VTALADALALPALTADGRDVSVAEVAAAGLHLSQWSGVERRAREAAACAVTGLEGPEEDVRAAAAAFRRERRLLSAEEMEAWLARRGLSAGAWMRWVRGDVARRYMAEGAERPDPEAVTVSAAELWAEALCSGTLARAARRLAELLVVPEHVNEEAPPPDAGAVDAEPLNALGIEPDAVRAILAELPRREVALECLERRVATPEAIEERIRAHQSDWLGVEFRELTLTEENVAREAMLCVRDDSMALEEVAPLAGVGVGEERALLADLPAVLQEPLLSACPGELLGPLVRDGEIALLVVDAKESPSADDPVPSRRAAAELLERALATEITSRVRWHDRL
jgi:hypothetical protein